MKNLFCFLLVMLAFGSQAEVSLSAVLGSHMVLQRNKPLVIKGTCTSENMIKVSFANRTRNVICQDGKWSVTFPAMEAGGPYQIAIRGENILLLDDIYMGDVYLCSGQSNMEWPLSSTYEAERELEDCDYPLIRLFTVGRDLTSEPKDLLTSGQWQVASRSTAEKFSAIGFLFGRSIHKSHGVAIGLIDNSWGGSEISPYMSADCFVGKGQYLEAIEDFKKSNMTIERSNEIVSDWKEGLQAADKGIDAQWQSTKTDRSTWEITTLPGKWESNIWPDYDGIGWYAKTFDLKDEPDNDATVHLGQIDDADYTYINGQLIGSMDNAHDKTRIYGAGKSIFKKGKNEIVIRMADYTGGGGLSGRSQDLFIQFENGHKEPLAGEWMAKKGTENYPKPVGLLDHNTYPTSKYNGMVHPLIDTKLSGILWYQGESDWAATRDYAWKLIRMIVDYRASWDQSDLPFLFVQLANWTPVLAQPGQANWGEVRKSQDMALMLPYTAMVTAIDLGDADDIHPRDKQSVASRLVAAADHMIYNRNVAYRSPHVRSVEMREEGYLVTFEHVGDGLKTVEGVSRVTGFAVLENGVWKRTFGTLVDNDQVLVSSKKPTPTVLRYLWADNPGVVSLYNSLDLPALPFEWIVDK